MKQVILNKKMNIMNIMKIVLVFLLCFLPLALYGQSSEEDMYMPIDSPINTPLLPKAQTWLHNLSSSWSLIGPTSSSYQDLGRVLAVDVDKTDYNTIYIGTAKGGLWKTTNGGANWSNVTDILDKAGMEVNSVVIDPNNHNIL